MTEPRTGGGAGPGRGIPVPAVVFVLFLALVAAAGGWLAWRHNSMSTVEPSPAGIQAAALADESDSGTSYSAYSVQAPPVVRRLQGASFSSDAETSVTGRPATAPADGTPRPPRDFVPVSFRKLAGFDYGTSAALAADARTTSPGQSVVPAEILALHGKKISIIGYMMPIEFDRGRVRSFLLMKDQSLCCFGLAPRLNDFIAVRVADKEGVPPATDVMIQVRGILQVGEVRNNGIPIALYTMNADKVIEGRR